jgi:transcriptional antiterminator RfaH
MNSISTSTIRGYSIKNCREENKWIAIYTKARHEKQVQRQLELMGIEAYVPLKKEYHRWSDRVKLVDVPLIPSYVFVRPNPTQYLKMFTVNGIVNVVKFHGRVAYIRDEEIELLKKAEKCDEVVLISNEEYKENDEVEIVEGMFAGYKGRVVDNGNKCKVVIRIEPIEYSLVVDVESKYVRLLVPVVV